MDSRKLTIQLDLESILDVRYGTIVHNYPELKDNILFNFPQYCNRDHDNMWLIFPDIVEEDWVNVYTNRDEEVLKVSPRTSIFSIVDSIIRSAIGYGNLINSVVLKINGLGYNLTESEVDMFILLVSSRFEHKLKVEFINITHKDLTPEFMLSEFDVSILYDFNKWFKVHGGEVLDNPRPNLMVYSPLTLLDKKQADRELLSTFRDLKLEGDPISSITDTLNHFIGINFIDNRFFCPISII